MRRHTNGDCRPPECFRTDSRGCRASARTARAVAPLRSPRTCEHDRRDCEIACQVVPTTGLPDFDVKVTSWPARSAPREFSAVPKCRPPQAAPHCRREPLRSLRTKSNTPDKFPKCLALADLHKFRNAENRFRSTVQRFRSARRPQLWPPDRARSPGRRRHARKAGNDLLFAIPTSPHARSPAPCH